MNDNKREIIRLRKTGMRYSDIAKTVDCSFPIVQYVLSKERALNKIHPSLRHLEEMEWRRLLRNGIQNRDELVVFLENHRLTELRGVGVTLEKRILEKMNIEPGSKC